MPIQLSAHEVTYNLAHQRILDGVSLNARAGRIHALLGSNGAGKSTLLKLLSADIKPSAGTVKVALNDGLKHIHTLTPTELAHTRAVLPQLSNMPFPLKAQEVIEMGRYPHRHLAPNDNQTAIDNAVNLLGVGHLLARDYPSLSGGEQQRTQLARVLAQDAPILLLDEPVSALDLSHQHQLMHTLRQVADKGCCVVIVLHDMNLALRYADDATVLYKGQVSAQGEIETVITPNVLKHAFSVEACVNDDAQLGCRQIVVLSSVCGE